MHYNITIRKIKLNNKYFKKMSILVAKIYTK